MANDNDNPISMKLVRETNGAASVFGNIGEDDMTLTLTMTKLSLDDIKQIRAVLAHRSVSITPCLHATVLIDHALSRT